MREENLSTQGHLPGIPNYASVSDELGLSQLVMVGPALQTQPPFSLK